MAEEFTDQVIDIIGKGVATPGSQQGGPLPKAEGGGSSALTASLHGLGQRGMGFGTGAFLLREQITIWGFQEGETRHWSSAHWSVPSPAS